MVLRYMGVLPNLQGPEPRCRGHVDTIPGVGGVPRPPGTQDGVVSHSDPGYLNHRNSAQEEEEDEEGDLTWFWSTLETLQCSLAVLSTGALMLVSRGTGLARLAGVLVVLLLVVVLVGEVVEGADGRGTGSVVLEESTEGLK